MALGDLSLIDTEDIDNFCYFPDLIRISSTLYASCFGGGSSDGYIKTFTISAAGAISAAIDSKEFDTDNCGSPSIVHVSGDVFAIAYTGPTTDGYLKTIEIDSSGNISNVLDSWEFDTSQCYDPHIYKIYGNIFVIGYCGPDNHGELITVTISDAGAITTSAIASTEFDSTYGRQCRIMRIDGNVYAIAYSRYTGSAYETGVKTLTITPAGAIGSVIDSLFWSGYIHSYPEILRVSGSIHAVAYHDGSNKGQLVTLDIQPNGTVGNAVIDTWNFSLIPDYTTTCTNRIGVIMATPDTVAVAFKDLTTNDGWIVSAEIDAQGSIGTTADTYEFEIYDCDSPRILKISDELIVINFYGSSAHNYIKTFGVVGGGGTVTPGEETTEQERRVSGIRHIYRPGSYRMEVSLGGVSTIETFELYEPAKKPAPALPTTAPVKPSVYPMWPEADPGKSRPVLIPTLPGIWVPRSVAEELSPELRKEGFEPTTGKRPTSVWDVLILGAKYGFAQALSPLRRLWNVVTPWSGTPEEEPEEDIYEQDPSYWWW